MLRLVSTKDYAPVKIMFQITLEKHYKLEPVKIRKTLCFSLTNFVNNASVKIMFKMIKDLYGYPKLTLAAYLQ